MNADNTYGDAATTRHLYEVEYMNKSLGARFFIRVHANNRTQAAAIARRNGFDPASVNMIG
jgi:hypothetical protein